MRLQRLHLDVLANISGGFVSFWSKWVFDILSNMSRMFVLHCMPGSGYISVQGVTGVLVSLSLSVCLRVFVTGIFLTRVHCMSLGRAEPEVRLF